MESVPKPITVAREDFINDLVKLINSAQMPLCMVEYILKDTIAEVHTAAIKQMQEDKDVYDKAVKAKQSNGDKRKTKVAE